MLDLKKLKKEELLETALKMQNAITKWCEKALEDNCEDAEEYVEGLLEDANVEVLVKKELQIDVTIPITLNPAYLDAETCLFIINGREYKVDFVGKFL